MAGQEHTVSMFYLAQILAMKGHLRRRPDSQAFAAAKVMSRAGTEAQEKGVLHELEFLQRISEDSLHPGRAHVIQLRDHFHQYGADGKHLCIIMEPLLQDLRTFYRAGGGACVRPRS
ncbi:hypothetical protein BV20DRAFT_583773 [Pilatotrama ljubarskyi]|nr:hypothetical protein BV20DRAFT_583773 [Pilatotrama ljubarskyi]